MNVDTAAWLRVDSVVQAVLESVLCCDSAAVDCITWKGVSDCPLYKFKTYSHEITSEYDLTSENIICANNTLQAIILIFRMI